MKLYTKKGDSGMTSLMNDVQVSKTDDRIELLGTIDELSSNIGLAKILVPEDVKKELSSVQERLITIMAGIADPRNLDFKIKDEEITYIEKQIDKVENAFPREKKFILYGGCESSARLDVARAIARRAERRFRKVSLHYGVDMKAMQYMNRLSDYLYVLARYEDYKDKKCMQNPQLEQVIQEVLKNMQI